VSPNCLRCKTEPLNALPLIRDVQFFECPRCHRHYTLHAGGALTFRWLHPISVALYGVIFSREPVARAPSVAQDLSKSQTAEWLSQLVSEIELELADPTQDLQLMLDCCASDAQLREFLRLVAEGVKS
jgi:transposase-like protein